jgi:hypothetical protein
MEAAAELAALMALRVRGRADAAQVARAVGCSEADAVAVLDGLRACGAVAPLAADRGLLALTDDGRAELARRLAAEPIDRAAFAASYERFLVADRGLKTAISGWQLAAEARKPEARAAVLAAAAESGGVVAELARTAARLAPYGPRIAAAAAAIAAGDPRFVASPRVDSLHGVWFELHEDLLVTLGRTRET